MHVAIIGAGIAGMSCAIKLQKYGIKPVIFEKNARIGDNADFVAVSFRIFSKSIIKPFNYHEKKYGIKINPINSLNEIHMKSRSNEIILKGNHGFLYKRGIDNFSIENQLASLLEVPVQYDSIINFNDIKDNYDYLVIASADSTIPKKLKVWSSSLNAYVRIATVLGSFNPNSAKIWFNTAYARNCFAYLGPLNNREARLTLIVNDISGPDLDFYWRKFINKENINYTVVQTRDMEHTVGNVERVNIENIYLTGNTGGFIDDFMGLGIFKSMESGILAAKAIAEGSDYNKLVKPLQDNTRKIHEYRKAVNTFDNQSFDNIVNLLCKPGLKQFIYNNPFFRARHFSFIARGYSKLKGFCQK